MLCHSVGEPAYVYIGPGRLKSAESGVAVLLPTPTGRVLSPMLHHHPDRPIADLRRILRCMLLAHGPSLSKSWASGKPVAVQSERSEEPQGRVAIGTMHLAKGLEFKAVAVIACDDDILPLQERVETVSDESELDEVCETERQLFYVACTRARDHLLISAVAPGSEFIDDFLKRMP